jgi:ribosome biogenesis protein MAK21
MKRARRRSEVEGLDEDDDLSMHDLESAYSASDDGSEAGIDLGGGAGDDQPPAEDGGLFEEDVSDAEELQDMPDLDSEDDALLDDDDELPEDFEIPQEPVDEASRSKKKRKERKKLKQLPTFASAEDYAKMIGDDDDDDM